MKIIGKTLYGLESTMASELESLGVADIRILNRAVSFSGDFRTLYRVNYLSRTALSFLVQIAEFRIRTKNDLYNGALKVQWDSYLTEKNTLAVVPVVNSPLFSHTGYPALVVKDAIADFFRKKSGIRPSVDPANADLTINLHISNDLVTISADSSVVPLFKRGYRTAHAEAPMNEVLAAGIVALSGWNGSTPLIDPMCGSGTIAIEAAMVAAGIAPGRTRKFFGFQRWRDYDQEIFDSIIQEAEKNIKEGIVQIKGSDISAEAIDNARANAEKAGVSGNIAFSVADFAELPGSEVPVTLIFNPPYGERLQSDDLNSLYGKIGSALKHRFAGSQAWIITSNPEAAKNIGLKPAGKTTLFNGALECRLLKYMLYQGSKRREAT